MRSRAPDIAARLVRLWTSVYTLGMPAVIRDARLNEINCDLWECQHDCPDVHRVVGVLAGRARSIANVDIARERKWRLSAARGCVFCGLGI